MRTDRRNRCDQIVDLIDRCLAECGAADLQTTCGSGKREQRPPAAA